MDLESYRSTIASATEAIVEVVKTTPADRPVPSCPGWDLGDLVFHLGGVHRWAAEIVARPVRDLADIDRIATIGPRPAPAELAGWLSAGATSLIAALAAAPRDLACFTLFATDDAKRMWTRRQAHETLIHRVDAELASGSDPAPFSSEIAVDNIDELLTDFVPRSARLLRSNVPRRLAVVTTDSDDSWAATIGTGDVETVRGTRDGDCVVSGRALELDLALWNRGGVAALEIEGDRALADLYFTRAFARE